MSKILFGIAGLLLVGGAIFFFYFRTSQAEGGSLNVYSGGAEIIRGEKQLVGKTGEKILAGDILKVPEGARVSVILKDGSVIRLESGSEVHIKQLLYEGKNLKAGEYEVKNGKLWSKVKPLNPGATWEVETPSVVAAVRGTSFNVGYLNKTSRVFVYKNQVGVNLKDGGTQTPVNPSGFFQIRDENLQPDFEAGPAQILPDQIDDWIKFNIQEDNKLDGVNGEALPKTDTATSTLETSITTPTSTPATTPTEGTPPVQPQPNPSTPATTPPSQNPPPAKTITALNLTATKTSITKSESSFLKLEATYSDGSKENVSPKATWVQNPEIGSFSNSLNGSFFNGILEGKTTITGKFGEKESNAIQITVTPPAQTAPAAPTAIRLSLTYVKNSPPRSITYVGLPNFQFKATAYYSDQTTRDVTSESAWSHSGTAGGSFDGDGHYYPASQGVETITATFGNLKTSSQISVP
jgi:hypothetical protein